MDGGSIVRAMENMEREKGRDYVTWKEITKESVLFPIMLSKTNRIPSDWPWISQLKVEYTNRRNS